ncbi:hypothetical protein PMI07_006322 [Rhizobium sp. CF080]|nr:hypothetical protein PMI07_006322 [Rhizobium sp. CF080]
MAGCQDRVITEGDTGAERFDITHTQRDANNLIEKRRDDNTVNNLTGQKRSTIGSNLCQHVSRVEGPILSSRGLRFYQWVI